MSINYVYKIQCHMTCITIKYYTEKCKFMGNELRESPARCWTRQTHPSVVKFGVSISGLAIAAVTASFQTPAKHLSPRNGDWPVFGNTRLYTVCGVCSSDTRCLGPTDGCMSLVFPCLVFGNTKLHD